MRLLLFLLKSSRYLFLQSVVFSILGGITTTGLLMVINHVLGHDKGTSVIVAFVVPALFSMIFRGSAGMLLAGLSQDALLQLRMELSQQIIRTPLRSLEPVGGRRIMAGL